VFVASCCPSSLHSTDSSLSPQTCEYLPNIESLDCDGNQWASAPFFVFFFLTNLYNCCMALGLFVMVVKTHRQVVHCGKFHWTAALSDAVMATIAQQVFLFGYSVMFALGLLGYDINNLIFRFAIPIMQLLFGTVSCLIVVLMAWSWTRLIVRTGRFSEAFLHQARVILGTIVAFFFMWVLIVWVILGDVDLVAVGTIATAILDLVVCLVAARAIRRAFSLEFTTTGQAAMACLPFACLLPPHARTEKGLESAESGIITVDQVPASSGTMFMPFILAVYEAAILLALGCCSAVVGLVLFSFFDGRSMTIFIIGTWVLPHIALFEAVAVNDFVRFVLLNQPVERLASLQVWSWFWWAKPRDRRACSSASSASGASDGVHAPVTVESRAGGGGNRGEHLEMKRKDYKDSPNQMELMPVVAAGLYRSPSASTSESHES